MNEIIIKIIPVVLIFLLGYFFKRINLVKKDDGDLLLKLVYNLALPALIILSISKIELQLSFIYLPIAAAIIILATSTIAYFVGGWLKLSRSTLGAFIVGSTIMNIGFSLPFFIAAFGNEGLARISLFDLGNGLLTYTFVYFLACKYGSNSADKKVMIKKFIASPPIWAILVALLMNLFNLELPSTIDSTLGAVGALTMPLIMLALGVYFSPKITGLLPVFLATFIRMAIGLTVGWLVVQLFDLDGLNRLIVLIGSATPVGYNTLTFSAVENLDKEFAASLVSFSILLGLLFLPFLIIVLT